MEENLYLNLARADMICNLKNKIVDINNFKYLHRQLNDDELFSRLVFEITRGLYREEEYNNMKDILINEKEFIDKIINCIDDICTRKTDKRFLSALWIYLIFINKNKCFGDEMKGEYLNDISPSFYVNNYFMLEYYNSLLDNIMSINPINVTRLNEVKNKVKEMI